MRSIKCFIKIYQQEASGLKHTQSALGRLKKINIREFNGHCPTVRRTLLSTQIPAHRIFSFHQNSLKCIKWEKPQAWRGSGIRTAFGLADGGLIKVKVGVKVFISYRVLCSVLFSQKTSKGRICGKEQIQLVEVRQDHAGDGWRGNCV